MSNKKHGFTIIEVVLVLAIAGLIFLMVFVALPALQRSQRDTQRRQDVARVATAITQYQANNGGNIPLPDTPSKAYTSYNKNESGNFAPTNANYPCSGSDVASSDNIASQFRCDYLDGANFKDPNGEEYRIRVVYDKTPNSPAINNFIQIFRGVNCNNYETSGTIDSEAQPTNDYAIVIKLEGSGYYCLDNQ